MLSPSSLAKEEVLSVISKKTNKVTWGHRVTMPKRKLAQIKFEMPEELALKNLKRIVMGKQPMHHFLDIGFEFGSLDFKKHAHLLGLKKKDL